MLVPCFAGVDLSRIYVPFLKTIFDTADLVGAVVKDYPALIILPSRRTDQIAISSGRKQQAA